MDEPNINGKNNIFISAAIIGVLAIAVLGVLALSNNKNSTNAAANLTPPTNSNISSKESTSPTADQSAATKYKDGSYSAKASYSFPNGSEILSLNVSIKGDIITDTNVSVEINDRVSQEYVNSFLSGYKPMVIGKDASSLNLTRVAGSSLTSNGFNDALDKIRSQASS